PYNFGEREAVRCDGPLHQCVNHVVT
ncbi:MAG: hypothetical protein JWQ91_1868, partial [Aeromicrobium sp.]|nr:hypothetical protein [Aeromicrobium sp.]